MKRVGAAAIAVLFIARLGQAQPRDQAGAEKLYDEAAALLAKGDFAAACPKFEQSQKLDPAAGTMMSLAGCAEHDGKIATAYARLKEARRLNADTASATRREQMEKFIGESLARIEPRLPMVTIDVYCASTDAPNGRRKCNDQAGLKVLRSKQDVTAALGTSLPVDPGQHPVEVTAPGFKTNASTILAEESKQITVDLVIEAAPSEPTEPKAVDPTPRLPDEPVQKPTPKTPESSSMSGLEIGGIVIGVVGLATIGASIGTGVVAQGKKSELDDGPCIPTDRGTLECPDTETYEAALDLSDSGSSLALASTVTTFVGAALVSTGVTMFVIGMVQRGSTEKGTTVVVHPVVGGGLTGISITGAF